MLRAWRHRTGDAHPLAFVACEVPVPVLAADQILLDIDGAVLGVPEHTPVPGVTPGGAGVGTVVAAGPSAEHLMGIRVVVGPDQGCGECDVCRRGVVVACPHGVTLGRTADGTLATSAVARARWACQLHGELCIPGPAAALLGREAAWAYAMFVRASVAPGEPVVVFGNGVIARFLVEIAIAKGTRPMVLVRGEQAPWQSWVRGCGAVPVVVAATEPIQDALRAAAGAGGYGHRPWHIFVTSADVETRRLALSVCGPGSRVALLARRALGQPTGSEMLAVDTVSDVDGTVLGVAGAHPDLLPELAALVVRGEVDIAGATEVISPADLPQLADRHPSAGPPRAMVFTPG